MAPAYNNYLSHIRVKGLTNVSNYAVIQTGGKQYRVQPGDVIDVEKLEDEVGSRIDLSSVLLVGEDDAVSVGTPTVDGAKVTAEIADQFRGPKIIVYKYKAKTRYRRKNGHRQSYTRLRIRHILTGGAEEPEEVVVEAVAEEAVEEATPAPAPRRRRRTAQPAASAEEPAAEEVAEEPVASAEEADFAEATAQSAASAEEPAAEEVAEEPVASAEEAEAAEPEATAEESVEAAAEEAPTEESAEGEKKA